MYIFIHEKVYLIIEHSFYVEISKIYENDIKYTNIALRVYFVILFDVLQTLVLRGGGERFLNNPETRFC